MIEEKQDADCQRCGGKGCIACDAREQEPKPLVGLTLQEVSAIWDSMGTWNSTNIQAVYNAIWKAIKEKNNA